MTIQFTLAPEYIAAAKALITQIDPSNTTPSDSDVVTYVSKTLVSGLLSVFPGVYLASQAATVARIASDQASIQSATLAALNITAV